MADLALYRKYRSGDFSQVIGQDHVVKTLTGALEHGRLRHAYLFTGPRGVGKTSVARLLARALNCTGTPKPCNKCSSCLTAINSSLDIIEMDAASNRSIDSIRDLREKISLAPTAGRYKVYIIDEVHMLTSEAFNALLKTLEEPPSHAVFILATTEAHKLPETIVSRTQAFNFKPISVPDLTSRLASIAKSENITVTPDALEVIATTARGGFRDAISMLDQLAGYGAGTITREQVHELLGYSSTQEITLLNQAISSRDTAAALTVSMRLEASGAQPTMIATQAINQWRHALLASSGAAKSLPPEVQALATAISPARIAAIINALVEVLRSNWPQLTLETTLVLLTSQADSVTTSSNTSLPASPKQRAATQKPAAAPQISSETKSKQTDDSPTQSAQAQASLWPKVLVLIKSENNSLGALLQMYQVDFNGAEITIKPRFNFHRDLFLKPANRTAIENAATKVYGYTIRIFARTEESGKVSKRALPDPTAELVSSALEILGGEVVE